VQFTINITNDQPIWFHCKQLLHCGMGMVGSINAPTNGTNTFAAFQQAALNIGSNEVEQTSGGAVTGGVNGIATATPADTGIPASAGTVTSAGTATSADTTNSASTANPAGSSTPTSSSAKNIASMGAVLCGILAVLVLA
jgi:hypothetical protein